MENKEIPAEDKKCGHLTPLNDINNPRYGPRKFKALGLLYQEYLRCRQALADLEVNNGRQYRAACELDPRFSDRPSEKFLELFGYAFSWDDYLGRKNVITTLPEIRAALRTAAIHAITERHISRKSIKEPSASLYAAIVDASPNTCLPIDPIVLGFTVEQLFVFH